MKKADKDETIRINTWEEMVPQMFSVEPNSKDWVILQ